MYSTILGTFHNSLNALRSYVVYTNEAIKKKVEDTLEQKESKSQIFALLLRHCAYEVDESKCAYYNV